MNYLKLGKRSKVETKEDYRLELPYLNSEGTIVSEDGVDGILAFLKLRDRSLRKVIYSRVTQWDKEEALEIALKKRDEIAQKLFKEPTIFSLVNLFQGHEFIIRMILKYSQNHSTYRMETCTNLFQQMNPEYKDVSYFQKNKENLGQTEVELPEKEADTINDISGEKCGRKQTRTTKNLHHTRDIDVEVNMTTPNVAPGLASPKTAGRPSSECGERFSITSRRGTKRL